MRRRRLRSRCPAWLTEELMMVTRLKSEGIAGAREIGLVVAGLAVTVVAGCARTAPEVAVRRDVVATLRLEGTVIAPPGAVSTIYPPYQTTVKKVDSTINARVRKGDPLIE